LLGFLHGSAKWDWTPNALLGSGATDWAEIGQRMNYIVDLFRSRHLEDHLFAAPFTEEQVRALAAGQIPPGPL
jgi:hypothetical protein